MNSTLRILESSITNIDFSEDITVSLYGFQIKAYFFVELQKSENRFPSKKINHTVLSVSW